MNSLEMDLRFLGVLDKALSIGLELGPEAAVRYIRSSYHLLSKVYHPDMHQKHKEAAERGQRKLNQVKERLDKTSDQELARFIGGQTRERPGHPRVLVVEDEDGLRDNLAELMRLEGYHVGSAANGLLGLRAQLSFRPDLVVTDVVMPIMNGVEMVRQMRVREPGIKALFISGFFGTRSVKDELVSEIEGFGYPMLGKPFKPSQLFNLMRQALS